MADLEKINISYELNEITNQISLTNKIGFFFGAGTSMALGLPGIEKLTNHVIDNLSETNKGFINLVKEELGSNSTIEDILNHIRLIREITKEEENKLYNTISGTTAKSIDIEICNIIYDHLSTEENKVLTDPSKILITKKFFSWLNLLNLSSVAEVFTPNYDLIFESSLEELQLPFFDGFVGSNEPFFLPESIEKNNSKNYPPQSWIRIWKIHGSLGWFWKECNGKYSVVRLGRNAKTESNGKEIVIYPSKEKYESSRKQPFLSYLDRLKNSLVESDGLFIFCGYSFGDEHINEIIFNGLKFNKRLHVIIFLYDEEPINKIKTEADLLLNMTILSPTKLISNGVMKEVELKDNYSNIYWDDAHKRVTLGDFSNLVNFLVESSGKKMIIEENSNSEKSNE